MLDLLKFDITARDRASQSLIKMKSELGGIKGALVGVNDYARRTGKSMRNIGAGLSAAVTAPLVLAGRNMVQMYDTQVKAEASVKQAILSTGGAAGKTIGDLKGLAAVFEEITLFGDEDILRNVTAPLLTFTEVQGDVFDRGQKNIVDYATAMKIDLKSASILVGKALNDPVKGLDALARGATRFTDSQKQVIKSLVETGDVAGAQAAILKELEVQYGGQAAAAAGTPLGQWKQLGNAIGGVKEELGKEIVPFLKPLLEYVKQGVKWFANLSPEVKKNIVVFGGLAAAAGPVLALLGTGVLGVTALSGALTIMGAALLTNPVFLGIAAIAGGAFLIYKNWDGIKAWFGRLWDGVKSVTAAGWELIKTGLLDYTAAGLIYKNWDGISNWFTNKWRLVKVGASAVWGEIKDMLASKYSPTKLVYSLWEGMGDWFRALAPELTAAFGDLWAAIKAEVSSWPGRMIQTGKDMIAGLFQGMNSETDPAQIGYWIGQDLSAGISQGLIAGKPSLGAAGADIAEYLERSVKDPLGIRSPSRVFAGIGKNIMEGLGLGLRNNAAPVLAEMGGIAGALVDTSNVAGQVDRQFATTFFGIIRGASSARDAISRLADSLADKILTNTFTNLFGSIGLGSLFGPLFGSAKGNVFSGGAVVPFANGGIVNGPTLFPMRGGSTGLMGEAGPEAIMPLSRGSDGRLGVRVQGGGGTVIKVHYAPVIQVSDGNRDKIAQIENALMVANAQFESRTIGTIIKAQKRRVLG